MARSVPDHDDVDDLRRMARLKRFAPIADRLRAVILTRRGHAQKAIAQRLERTEAWVHRWVGRYIEDGLDGLSNRPRPGQPVKLRREDEQAFIARVQAGPTRNDGIGVWRGTDLQRLLDEEFDATYSLNGVYALLARLGLSWVVARPRHPKSDPQAAERFKAQAPLLSRRSAKPTRTKRSRSGAKTRRA